MSCRMLVSRNRIFIAKCIWKCFKYMFCSFHSIWRAIWLLLTNLKIFQHKQCFYSKFVLPHKLYEKWFWFVFRYTLFYHHLYSSHVPTIIAWCLKVCARHKILPSYPNGWCLTKIPIVLLNIFSSLRIANPCSQRKRKKLFSYQCNN